MGVFLNQNFIGHWKQPYCFEPFSDRTHHFSLNHLLQNTIKKSKIQIFSHTTRNTKKNSET